MRCKLYEITMPLCQCKGLRALGRFELVPGGFIMVYMHLQSACRIEAEWPQESAGIVPGTPHTRGGVVDH